MDIGLQNAVINATVGTATDQDYFSFTAEAGRTYVIETFNIEGTPGGSASGLWLYNNNAALIGNDQSGINGTGDTNARIVHKFVTGGIYFIKVSRAVGRTWQGAYSLRILPKHNEPGAAWDNTNDSEPNGTLELANNIQVGLAHAQTHQLFDHSHFITKDSDYDWYHFNADAGRTYIIETYNIQGTTPTATGLWLYNSSGSLIANDQSGVNGMGDANARITHKFVTSDTYYIKVGREVGQNWLGAYSIRILPKHDEPGADWDTGKDSEPNGSLELANEIIVGSNNGQSHQLFDHTNFATNGSDYDWYHFNAGAGETFVIETFNIQSSTQATGIWLYNSDKSLIKSDQNGTATGTARITYTFSATGRYYFLVKSSQIKSWIGSYSIRVCKDSCVTPITFTPTIPTATPTIPTATPTLTSSTNITTEWVTLVFLNGDNSLDQWTENLFNELETAVYNDTNLIIWVLWDRSGNGDSALFHIQPDNSVLLAQYTENTNKWSHAEENMGDPATLLKFVNSMRNQNPANHYLLSIVDHGGGWSPQLHLNQGGLSRYVAGASGFSWDLHNGNDLDGHIDDDYDYFSTKEMSAVFADRALTEDPIDLVFYDACLMAMFEEVHEIHSGARYLVASQNETWSRFPYALYLNDITSRNPEEQAKWMVDQYFSSLDGYPKTMSVFDLKHTTALSQSIDSLAEVLISTASTNKVTIQSAFSLAQKFDYDYDLDIGDEEGYVDLGDFSKELIKKFPNSEVSQKAQSVLDILNGNKGPFVLYERHQGNIGSTDDIQVSLDRASGLSIYLPLGEDDPELVFYTPNHLGFAASTVWDTFIFKIIGFQPGAPDDNFAGGRGNGNIPQPQPIKQNVYLPIVSR